MRCQCRAPEAAADRACGSVDTVTAPTTKSIGDRVEQADSCCACWDFGLALEGPDFGDRYAR